ncbi:MAG TPA: site-specific DNA-methyltransferase, partial [Alphaproteobacteria bacterium]|nr:site-specific DNA-methyltransferase [Alphaproteobacteria bacterium]
MPTLEFKGKQFVYSHHHSVPFRELVIDKDKSLSKKPNLDDNLIIHGDNLHALKALMPQYAGKIKCIYIDPPYNTGNEGWCYNDNVNSPLMKEWVAKNANPVDKEDLQRHDKWLCMMYPRLKLLHELLADDGVIFVSIDDHEQHHLRAIMDEIFGEENFVANIVWQKKYAASNDVKGIAAIHDFIIC